MKNAKQAPSFFVCKDNFLKYNFHNFFRKKDATIAQSAMWRFQIKKRLPKRQPLIMKCVYLLDNCRILNSEIAQVKHSESRAVGRVDRFKEFIGNKCITA